MGRSASGPDRHRGQGIRPSEGPHRNLSRRRIRTNWSPRSRSKSLAGRPSRPRRRSDPACRPNRRDRRRQDFRHRCRAGRPHPDRRDTNEMTRSEGGTDENSKISKLAAVAGMAAASPAPASAQAAPAAAAAFVPDRRDGQQGRHVLDAGVLRTGADDVGAGPRPVLRRPCPRQEHAFGADAGSHDRLHRRP